MEAVNPNRHSLGESRKPKTVIFGLEAIRIEGRDGTRSLLPHNNIYTELG